MAGRSPAHGFCDDEQTRRLLRSRPPRQALAWAGACLGGPVTSARALRGGMSSAVHLVTARRPDGRRAQAVLRRYVRPDPDEPDPAAREARALRLAGAAAVPTPALLAVDPDGTQAGVPALLMSRLPGRVDWWPSDLDRWLERLAALLPRIHGTALPPGDLPVDGHVAARAEHPGTVGVGRVPRVVLAVVALIPLYASNRYGIDALGSGTLLSLSWKYIPPPVETFQGPVEISPSVAPRSRPCSSRVPKPSSTSRPSTR